MSLAPTRILPPSREPSSRRRALLLGLTLLTAVACWNEASPPAERPTATDPQAVTSPPLGVPDVLPTEPRYAASHVLVAWQGAARAPGSITRTEEQALERARELHRRAMDGQPLEAMARAESDGPTAPRGGRVGVYATGTMMPEFEKAVASVEVGEIAPLVKSPFGFHIIRRDAIVEAHLWHVQVAWQGAWRAQTERSKDAARARAQEALQALRDGTPPDEVAQRFSDDPSAAQNGGDLGLVAQGQLMPAFERAAFELEPGQTSEIIETPYGFHVIRRYAPPSETSP